MGIGAWIAGLDDRVIVWLSQFASRWPLLDRFAAWLVTANIVKFGPFVIAICWFWFDKSSQQATNRKVLVESVLTGFAALVTARALALLLPFRPRPGFRLDLHFAVPFDMELRTWSSFPSDHAVMAFALAASMFRVSPVIGTLACLHAAIVICLPRLYLGLHYPSDLIFGGLIGVMMAFLASRLTGRDVVAAAILDVERKHAGLFYVIGFFVLYEIVEMFHIFRSLAVHGFSLLGGS